MSEPKHTPGPWHVETMRPRTLGMETVSAPSARHVADCSDIVGIAPDGNAFLNVDPDIIEANANLIAAAPDMFAALIAWRDQETSGLITFGGMDRARELRDAAIAKAACDV